jgi:flavin-dependent dehydrogenase
MLATAAVSLGAVYHRQARICGHRFYPKSGWQVYIKSPNGHQTLQARFLVDATGRKSSFQRQLTAKRTKTDQLIGIAVHFFPRNKSILDAGFTLIESAEHGWWYSAPQSGGALILVYMTDLNLYIHASKSTLNPWQDQLYKTLYTRQRVKGLIPSTRSRIFLAHSQVVQPPLNTQWIAVGDAAFSIDPLSGKGITTAIDTAIRAADAVEQHLKGDDTVLRTYIRQNLQNYTNYLITRKDYYRQEIRWPHSPFWQQRQS